jgi:hypothetical protein
MKPKEEAMNHSDGGDVDDLSDDPSSPESASFDDGDLLGDVHDDITAQLAAAGQTPLNLLTIFSIKLI